MPSRGFIIICVFAMGSSVLGLPAVAGASEVSAKVTVKRGAVISTHDLVVDAQDTVLRNDILETYVGKEAVRTLYVGKTLSEADIREPRLVKRNTRVSMIYRVGKLEIKAVGRALDEGSLGEMVSVMNLDSRKRVSGVVVGTGLVEMTP